MVHYGPQKGLPCLLNPSRDEYHLCIQAYKSMRADLGASGKTSTLEHAPNMNT